MAQQEKVEPENEEHMVVSVSYYPGPLPLVNPPGRLGFMSDLALQNNTNHSLSKDRKTKATVNNLFEGCTDEVTKSHGKSSEVSEDSGESGALKIAESSAATKVTNNVDTRSDSEGFGGLGFTNVMKKNNSIAGVAKKYGSTSGTIQAKRVVKGVSNLYTNSESNEVVVDTEDGTKEFGDSVLTTVDFRETTEDVGVSKANTEAINEQKSIFRPTKKNHNGARNR